MTSEPLPLKVSGVKKRFGDLAALDGVSLECSPGECLGLLGPNGAGKSTLIRTIVGRVRPSEGTVSVFDEPADTPSARATLGWIPQDLALYELLTCRENLETMGRYQGMKGKVLDENVAWCLEWSALSDRANDVAKTFSGGMKRRLNMAMGLIHRPKLVLMDEPTVGVDPQSRNRIFEMIEALRAGGTTVVYTTHYMEEAERLCDRIVIIDRGHVVAQGTKVELVQQTFGGRSDVAMRFAPDEQNVEAWVAANAGKLEAGEARFQVDQPVDVAGLLGSAGKAGLNPIDVSLRRPTLESVFLRLTGRSLRE
jgi:ABC-2 type transport system ATP-binding protein